MLDWVNPVATISDPNRSKSMLASSSVVGWVDENTTRLPDRSMAGATLGVHHSRSGEPLNRVTQRVTRSSTYMSGRRFVSDRTRGQPEAPPRFEAVD